MGFQRISSAALVSASAVVCVFALCFLVIPSRADGGPGFDYAPEPMVAPKLRRSNYASFYLYPNPWDWEEEHRLITDNVNTLHSSGFNSSRPVTMLIHGMLSDRHTILDVLQIKNAYLQAHFPTNLIMVDYGKLAISRLPYVLSPLSLIRLTETWFLSDRVVDEVVDFIFFLMTTHNLYGPESLHIVGFSHGGLLNRRIAKKLFALTGRRTKRVSVLEGGGETISRARSPEKRYADFVDYTVTSQSGLALLDPDYDAQFFVNGGGLHQPTCPNLVPVAESYCSHTSSLFYFAKSIRRGDIKACKCESTCLKPPKHCYDSTIYGQYAPDSSRGRYYVRLS